MKPSTLSAEARDFAQESDTQFGVALRLAGEDARKGLKYVLLRLSLLGLSKTEQKLLHQFARRIFAAADGTAIAEQVQQRKSASPLAIAITRVVSAAPNPQQAFLGAVFGAYAALGHRSAAGGDSLVAIAGAVALAAHDFVQQRIETKHFLTAK